MNKANTRRSTETETERVLKALQSVHAVVPTSDCPEFSYVSQNFSLFAKANIGLVSVTTGKVLI